jgi:hypothetical protein
VRLLSGLPPTVILTVEIITDEETHDPNPWRNYKRCLSDLPSYATHLVVIQDDAQVCHNFPQAVEQVVKARPENVLSLFVGGLSNRTKRDFLLALKAGRSWSPVNFRDIHHVVCLIWPVAKAQSFLAWAETATLPGHKRMPRSDDAIVGYWARSQHETVWATVPSLVEHPDDVASTVGRRAKGGEDKGRVALSFIGERDPLEINW